MSERSARDVVLVDWAAAVRANREQVERVREVPDGADFYAPVRSLFRADPRRSGDAVLDRLLALAQPGETWLDIGAGSGRYALPLALKVAEVIALDPSEGMLDGLRVDMAAHGVGNVRVLRGRWPADAEGLAADVSLLAHVGYDVEAIGPFLDAMERATRRLCVAVMMERAPASLADAFWPIVHGEPRAVLPALPELLALLDAQGRAADVVIVESERRSWASRDELLRFMRRQTWVAPGGPKDRRLQSALDERLDSTPGAGVTVRGQQPLAIGVVTWRPDARAAGPADSNRERR